MPDYLKIVFILAGILILIRFKVPLSVTLLSSAAVLGVFSISPLEALRLSASFARILGGLS